MISVNKTEKIYLECIDPDENHFKFYRMTKLDNGKWLSQNGRIGKEGTKRLFHINHDKNGWDVKYDEKITKGYRKAQDHHPHFAELALNHFGMTSLDTVVEAVDPDTQEKEQKAERILEQIATIKKALSTENPNTETWNRVNSIQKQVAENKTFPRSSAEFLNEIIVDYNI